MGDEDEQSKKLRRSSSLNHIANAEARRMKFASVDGLSELVWSPRNGLSLRCADLSFTGKAKLLSPNFLYDIGGQTNNIIMDRSTTSIEEDEEEEAIFRVNVELRTQDEVNRPLSGIGGSVEEMKLEREEIVEDNKVETNDNEESEEASSKRCLDISKAIGGESAGPAGSQEKPVNLNRGEKTNNTVVNVDSLEATDENDLAVAATKALVACESKGECLPEDETDVEKGGTSCSYRRRAIAKGKEKALSDGRSNEEEDEESFGSVESCNSAGLLLRGKKRQGFEQQLILGSKRLKTLSQECLGSTSKLKQDSSFMNWISNMTKGIWKGNEEEDNSPFVALTTTIKDAANVQVNAIVDQQHLSPCFVKENSGCRNTGFQSFFQSIYCPKKATQEEAVENNASLQELARIPEQCLSTKGDHFSSSGNEIAPVVAEHNISSGKVGFNQTSEAVSSGNKHEDKEPNMSLLSLSKSKTKEEEKACGEADEKVTNRRNSGLESLWISRFSSKSSFPQKKDLQTKEATKEANDPQKMLTDGFKNPNKILPVVSSLRIESSEAMASLFARLKHIMPSDSLTENAEEGKTNLICFYCGKKGHRLHDCLEVTDTELRDLVQNISARNGRKEASSLCIRCFQLSHWAATCPINAPPYSSGAEDRAMKHALASTSGTKLPFRDFTEVPKAVFDAVQVLRLTRTDVLKWISTKKSVSGLEGFFLRLRLGKWEEGLGGTGYHVARIYGAIEKQSSSSRKHSESTSVISVKVGGMTCFVESQFISNHDFLEEELKAWWRSAGKSAGRSGGDVIPSAEELSRKIQQRKMLGF